MSTILLAIGVIVILGIVAFFVFQKLQAQKTGLPTTPQVNPLQAPTPMPTPASTNELAKAEAYVQNQNYNEAITELKRILMTNPHHHGAMLKLLQVYGITKQFSAFNQLHQKIHEIADSETIREADFCKSLLAEEIAKTQTNNQTPSPAAPTQTDAGLEPNLNAAPEPSLEFDLETLDVPEPAAKTSVPTEPMLDLNDLDFNPSTPSAAPASAPSLDFDDLSFDEPKDNTPIAATEPTPSLDLGSDLDFNLEPQAPAAAPVAAVESKSDGLDFGDLDLGLGSEPKPIVQEPTPSLDLGSDLDFNLEPQAPAAAPVAAVESKSDGLDFGDLDLGLGSEPKPIVQEPTPSLDLGSDLDFNLEPQAPAAAPVAAVESKSDGLDFGDLDLGLGSEPKPIVQEPTPSLDLGSDLDFNLEPQAPAAAPVAAVESKSDGLDFGDLDLGLGSEPKPIVQEPTPSLDLGSDLDFNLEPQAPAAAPVAAVESKSDGLDFGDLDLGLGSEPKPIVQEPTPSLDLGSDLDFNLEPQAPAAAPVAAVESKSDGLDFGDLDLGLGSEPAPVAKPTITPVVETKSNDGLDFGDLDLGLSTPAPTPVAEPVITPASVTESKFAQEPISQPASAPAVKPSIGTPSELHFVDGLDNTGVTLNLAKRYLDLGEYDSAKRLLNEVIEVGNSDQKQEAKALIAQLS